MEEGGQTENVESWSQSHGGGTTAGGLARRQLRGKWQGSFIDSLCAMEIRRCNYDRA